MDSTTRNSAKEGRLFPLPPPFWASLVPDFDRGLLVASAVTPQGDRRRAHHWEPAEVERVLTTFVPESLQDLDPAVVAVVLKASREWVALAGPHDALSARQMIWAVAPMVVWLLQTLGPLDVRMFNHRNVEVWISRVNKGRETKGWRHLARTCLRRVGRKANPDGGWPPADKAEEIGRSPIAQPYHAEIEAVFQRVAELPKPVVQADRCFVAAGGCGAGLSGVEMSAAKTSDLQEHGNGRLAIQVRGNRPRLVPIRACWTPTVRQAARLAEDRDNQSSTWFLRHHDKNAVSKIAASLDFGEGGLNLWRARATWLTAHLLAGTSLPTLRILAGRLSAQVLIELTELAIEEIDPEQAVIEGLRA